MSDTREKWWMCRWCGNDPIAVEKPKACGFCKREGTMHLSGGTPEKSAECVAKHRKWQKEMGYA